MSSSKNEKIAKSYTPEFRNQAVRLVLNQEKNISQTARDLGIPLATLHAWVKKARNGEWSVESDTLTAVRVKQNLESHTQKPANISQKLYDQLSVEQKKNTELEKQVRRLMQEREILKKAMAYCLDVPK